MAYTALYRKYRPGSFSEMVGQRQIVQTLQNAVKTGRVSHAYLFCGPRGTGKTSVAKIFARVLNCESDTDRPCGKCENCRTENHPDIIEIDAASNNGVEEVRNLIERVKYAPMLGKYKVYIIDEVHMMTSGAFNALLKTIEEPPAHVIFILATTEPNKVLPTIISRCQRFDFKKISEQDIQGRLQEVARQEQINLQEDACEAIASLCQGGMRDALSILDQSISYAGNHITADDVRAIYGVVSPDDISQVFRDLTEHKTDAVMEAVEKMYNDGLDLTQFTADLITLLKDSLILYHSPETTLLDKDAKKRITEWFSPSPLAFRIALLQDLIQVYDHFRNASSVLDYLETVFLNYVDWKEDRMQKTAAVSHSHEGISEQSEKSKKSASKVSLKDSKKSDVSRETSPQAEKEKKNQKIITFSDNEVIGLLHIADKELRKHDQEKWEKRTDVPGTMGFEKFVNVLRNTQLVASGEDFMLLRARRMAASEINAIQSEEGFESFTEAVLGTPKYVYALGDDEYKRIIQGFMTCQKEDSFPAPPVIPRKKNTKERKEDSEESELKKYFPGIQITDD